MTVKDTIEREMILKAPRERVWAALTQEDLISAWFGTATRMPSLEVGQEIAFEWADYDHTSRGIIAAVEPMSHFAYRWEHGDADLNGPIDEEMLTLVSFNLEDAAEGTRLTLIESGFAALPHAAEALAENSSGWTAELAELKTFVEQESA